MNGEAWERQLESKEETERLAAAWQLMNAGEAVSLPALQAGLVDENADVRWYLTEALQHSPNAEALALVGKMLLDEDQFVRISAGDALVLAGRESGDTLSLLVEAVERETVAMSFRTFLGAFFDIAYIIEKRCADEKVEDRESVMLAGGRATSRLIEHTLDGMDLSSGERWMKQLRVWGSWIRQLRTTCRQCGFPVAAMFRPTVQLCLRRLTQEMGEREIALRLYAGILEQVYEREAAALMALGEIAGALGIEGVEVPEIPLNEAERPLLRAAIGEVLAELSAPQLAQVLVRLLRDGSDQVRVLAAQVLRQLDRPPTEIAAGFAEMAQDENELVRGNCVRMLGEIAGAGAVPVADRVAGGRGQGGASRRGGGPVQGRAGRGSPAARSTAKGCGRSGQPRGPDPGPARRSGGRARAGTGAGGRSTGTQRSASAGPARG